MSSATATRTSDDANAVLRQRSRMVWLHALSPLHIGAGRGDGSIDLPIIREAVTNWPYAPGSSLKGVISTLKGAPHDKRKAGTLEAAAFGKGEEQDSEGKPIAGNAGSIAFPDARLVCFPVRSLFGTFAWCTCEFALRRLQRDLTRSGVNGTPNAIPSAGESQVLVATDSPLKMGEGQATYVLFEDFDLDTQCDEAQQTAHSQWSQFIAEQVFADSDWKNLFQGRFSVISNDLFDFLVEHNTEVVARISLESDTKVVKETGLWYEENLPAESILAGFLWSDQVYESARTPEDLVQSCFPQGASVQMQLGGKASVNRGLVNCRFR